MAHFKYSLFSKFICIVKLKQGDSGSEAMICFGTKFQLSVDLIQLLKIITVLGFILRQCHKLFVK